MSTKFGIFEKTDMDKTTKNRDIWRYKLGNLEEFRTFCDEIGVKIGVANDVSILGREVQAGKLNMPNSLAVHPMEGADGDWRGNPGALTLRRYKRFASGGAGLIWAEAIAVVEQGRANPRQLWLHEETKGAFADMVKMMREAAAAIEAGRITIAGAGRMAFAYPDFAKNLLSKGSLDNDKVCVGCSACTQLMRDGRQAGCVVRDNKVYGAGVGEGFKNRD